MTTVKQPELIEEIKPLQVILHSWILSLQKHHYVHLPKLLLREVLTAWFRSYYFLFRKNAHVTTISFGELIALIKVHAHTRAQSETRPPYLQFQTSKRFKNNFILLWESFGTDAASQKHTKQKAAFLLHSYPQLFLNTVLVDSFFGSAVVHLPHPLTLDLRLICGEAGYIHSCGEAIYVRKIFKSERNQLVDKVEAYIQQREKKHPDQIFFFQSTRTSTLRNMRIRVTSLNISMVYTTSK